MASYSAIVRRVLNWGTVAEVLEILSVGALAGGLVLILVNGRQTQPFDVVLLLGLAVDLLALAVACRILDSTARKDEQREVKGDELPTTEKQPAEVPSAGEAIPPPASAVAG